MINVNWSTFNWNSVWWSFFFFVGLLACMIHTFRTYKRWRNVRNTASERHALEAAAWWFFRQDIGNDFLGLFMCAGGVNAFFRGDVDWTVGFLMLGALFYAGNKILNIWDDNEIRDAVSTYLEAKRNADAQLKR